MKRIYLAVMSLALATAIGPALARAQQPSAAPASSAAVPSSQPAFTVLLGRWVRPDGGYIISVRGVDAGGRLDASYANPAALPFYTAEVNRDGDALKVFLELRAGGYNGSTYTLAYDAASDQLKGVYYQAVARQRFEVAFVRTK